MKHSIIKVLAYLIGVPLITFLAMIAPIFWDVILFDGEVINDNYLIVFVLFVMIVSVPIIRYALKFFITPKED